MSSDVNHDDRSGDRFQRALARALGSLELTFGASQLASMQRHFEMVVQANRAFNLTRITEPADAAVKHYADSLSLLKLPGMEPDRALTLLDVGTGAGYPAVVLAIGCPAWRVTAIDGTGKKARFVGECGERLGLRNLRVEHARAETFAEAHGGEFDVVVLRAVTKLPPGLRQAAPLVGRDGRIVFYKSADVSDDEMREGENTARLLGLRGAETVEFEIKGERETLRRRLVCYGISQVSVGEVGRSMP